MVAVPPTRFGPVAQLGAHYIRIVGVGSSNLLRSTNKKTTLKGWFFLLVWYLYEEIRKNKCGADERRRRQLDGAEP